MTCCYQYRLASCVPCWFIIGNIIQLLCSQLFIVGDILCFPDWGLGLSTSSSFIITHSTIEQAVSSRSQLPPPLLSECHSSYEGSQTTVTSHPFDPCQKHISVACSVLLSQGSMYYYFEESRWNWECDSFPECIVLKEVSCRLVWLGASPPLFSLTAPATGHLAWTLTRSSALPQRSHPYPRLPQCPGVASGYTLPRVTMEMKACWTQPPA